MSPGAGEQLAALEDRIAAVLGSAPFELGESGLYCRREKVRPEQLAACEQLLLERRSVRVFDFNTGRPEELAHNVVAREGDDPAAYRGHRLETGRRVFRADHHYPLRSLARESTTPLVARWLRGLWRAGAGELAEEVAAAAFLADHCDPDIVFAQHLGRRAADRTYLEGPMPQWLAAAARRNDFIEPPPAALEPEASRLFYAGLGIERAIEAGEISFCEALETWCNRLAPWLAGAERTAAGRRLDAWERTAREAEARCLERIERWFAEGRGRRRATGALVALEAPERIDNADLYLWLARTGARPRVQALCYPAPGGGRVWKLRSHGDLDLMPLFDHLNRRFPTACFGGRAAAGGSRPGLDAAIDEVLDEIERWLAGADADRTAARVGRSG